MCGLRSEAAQKRLLTAAELTFQRAADVAQSMETATANAKQMHHTRGHATGSQKTDAEASV